MSSNKEPIPTSLEIQEMYEEDEESYNEASQDGLEHDGLPPEDDESDSELGSYDGPMDPVAALLEALMTEEGEPLVDVLSGIRDALQGIQDELHNTNKILYHTKK